MRRWRFSRHRIRSAARLFTPASAAAIALPTFEDTLPNRAGPDRLSTPRRRCGGAHVPQRRHAQGHRAHPRGERDRGAACVKPSRPGDAPHRLRLAVPGSGEVTHVMVFSHVHAAQVRPPLTADLMWRSVPVSPASVAARVRLPDGTLLVPTLKSLADADVEGTVPYRAVAIDAAIAGDDRASLWACSVTRDGWLSPLVGPWTL